MRRENECSLWGVLSFVLSICCFEQFSRSISELLKAHTELVIIWSLAVLYVVDAG